MKARFIDSGPCHPHFNMALDEALLEFHRPGDLTLRLYAWDPFALSLGFFQQAIEADEILGRLPDVVLTRRPTGGGAILHADELTFALVADAPQGPGSSRDLYGRMNGAIVKALHEAGVEAGERGGEPGTSGTSFLCFERHADFDVTIGARKIAGSAQRRKGHALLQHGSILLGLPPLAGDAVTSASKETGRRIGYEEFVSFLVEGALRSFGVPFEKTDLSEEVEERAKRLVAEKYGARAWIHRR